MEAELGVNQQQEPFPEALPFRVVERLTRSYAASGKFLGLYTMGEFWEEAAAARSDARAGWYAIVEWLENARAAYHSAVIAYTSQTDFQDSKFAADLEERLFLVTSRIKDRAPTSYQLRELPAVKAPANTVFAGVG